METLLPWVLQLHMNREQGIQTFRNLNKIGRPMMCEDPFDLNFSKIIKAIEDDQKKFVLFVE
jgi:hypothetical protein